MKTNIHPTYYQTARVICACGNTFTTGSTKPEIKVEICARCHPFFTGEMKYVDTVGKVEKFQKRQQLSETMKESLKQKTVKKTEKEERPKTLREMAQKIKNEFALQQSSS